MTLVAILVTAVGFKDMPGIILLGMICDTIMIVCAIVNKRL